MILLMDDVPHFLSSPFDMTAMSLNPSGTSSISNITLNDSFHTGIIPIHLSSPIHTGKEVRKNDLSVLSLNIGSLPANKEAFWSMLEGSDPDIVLRC